MALGVDAREPVSGPYDAQVAENVARLGADSPLVRAAGAEALGFLRAYSAEGPLIERLDDPAVEARRQAAMALAWCGGRLSVPRLLKSLDDEDWVVRQAAHVSLTNLTGMEFPFTSTASISVRRSQAKAWRDWWATVPSDRPPKEVFELLVGYENLAGGGSAAVSTTYKGPPDVLLDGHIGPAYWQTKNVEPPQWCTVDLDRTRDIDRVVIHQYSDRFVMTEYELATSLDNKTFDVVKRAGGRTPVELVVEFPPREARYVRVTSFGSVNPTYPSTFFEIEISGGGQSKAGKVEFDEPVEWRFERGLRALGALDGQGATEAILDVLGNSPPTASRFRPMVAAGIRSLGRLREEVGFQALARLLDNTMWARRAADALGDFGDRRAVPHLLAAYPKYAKKLDGTNPADVPGDDVMGFPSEDRMLETPYFISYALCRLPLDDPQDVAALAKLAPSIITNMQGDHDTFMLYQPEVGHLVTRHLMEKSGRRQEACEHVFEQLARPLGEAKPTDTVEWSVFGAYRMSTWLTAVCTDKKDLPRLLALLEHEEGWVRINAAKTIAWLGDKSAIEPIAKLLAKTKAEADFGYNGTFKNEEYDDPAPRWREGLIRALGILEAHRHTDLIIRVLNDERSVAEIRRAAADALDDLGNEKALAALEDASLNHSVYSVRHIARDAVRSHGGRIRHAPTDAASISKPPLSAFTGTPDSSVKGIVFIKGSNNIPNTVGTVEQADRWRATYAVTDSGPAYRPGRNLYILRPPRPDGKVTPLTDFPDGYVSEHELSWDGTQVIFSRRGQEDPWWQIWRINTDGTGLVQLTQGPYHHVGPTYLPDGRIVCATSHSGIRDEYHGYPCTALCVMNADGSDMHPVATNIGRDNEPAILNDGRIVFSRLEVFYSRNKTELTLHAMHPDGTQDVVLYGPERRQFWRNLDHGPKSPADGQESPLTHRVLRMTQPRPVAEERGIVVTTQGGLVLVGSRRNTEDLITPDYKERSYTTPFPMSDGTILCASTLKTDDREKVDLALYSFDPATATLELIYNDPATADFEPRPIIARRPPMTQPVTTTPHAYSGRFVCSSVFHSRERDVRVRGRLVRLIEGVPVIARHSTQTNPWEVWKNHGGTFARVLGTAPLAPDGSFYVEAPADRLLHFQVLDSDRRVINQQLTWIYPRPGETKSCVGCHENPHTTSRGNDPLATHQAPLDFLPNGMEFSYRAKAWFKGHLPAEIEERTRTVRAVNLMGR
jgi:HEAT repeat protein